MNKLKSLKPWQLIILGIALAILQEIINTSLGGQAASGKGGFFSMFGVIFIVAGVISGIMHLIWRKNKQIED